MIGVLIARRLRSWKPRGFGQPPEPWGALAADAKGPSLRIQGPVCRNQTKSKRGKRLRRSSRPPLPGVGGYAPDPISKKKNPTDKDLFSFFSFSNKLRKDYCVHSSPYKTSINRGKSLISRGAAKHRKLHSCQPPVSSPQQRCQPCANTFSYSVCWVSARPRPTAGRSCLTTNVVSHRCGH
jgi:hypothetical protein